MAPKKKAVRNAFYYFMLEVQRREQEKGNRINLQRASAIADPEWKNMTPEEKKVYNDMAQANSSKGKHCDDLTKKFTSLGVSYATIDAEQREKDEFMNIMLATIKNTVSNLDRETTLKTHKFFVCHVNFYYQTENNYHAPAEFALAVFNLERGVIDSAHYFIDVGKVPLGLKFVASDWCARTHGIPVGEASWAENCTDYYKIFEAIQEFIFKHSPSADIPPIYTMFDSLNTNYSHTAVQCALDNMCEAANMDPSLFKIYNIAILFYELRTKCAPTAIPSVAIMKSEIEKDVFSYGMGLGCYFHEEKDLSIYCSLSMVIRWIYTICDHCCSHLNIKLRLGFHIPKEANINWKQEARCFQEEEPSSSLNRTSASASTASDRPLTIIDHGKLKEKRVEEKLQQDALYQQCEALRAPKTSYSNKIGANFFADGASCSASQESPLDEDSEWTTVVGRSGGGHGRGKAFPKKVDGKKDIMPVSGRGRLAAMSYNN